ncbi:MAG: hypothetical protein ACRDTA_21925 [Pseudonocardiaceae bacterium]
MAAVLVAKDDQYVLNHCTRFLARDSTDSRHNFGQHEPEDPRAVVCEAWRLPVVDSHHDGVSVESSYAYNDVSFVYDGRGSPPDSVEGGWLLRRPVRPRAVRFRAVPL